MASTSPSTAPKRKWVPCSRRWRDKLQELANMEESQVRTVGGLIYVPNDEKFRIALIGTNEVLLGLRCDGTEVAIKKMIHANFKKLERELEVLLKYRFVSQYVVQYVDLAFDNDFGYIAMQLCDYNLEEYIERLQQPADPNHLREKVKEFLKGLKALHEEAKVIHRDIKPRNVLIDKDGRVRLADFEISHILDPDQTTKATERAGTKNWEATEIIKTKPSDQKSQYKRSTDIQVAGMLVFYILSGGKHLFGDDFMCIYNICSGTPVNLHDLKDVEAEDLVESMVNINPKERPRITEVLKHPYFWNDDRKEMFLGEVGNVSEVENYKEISDENLAKDVRGKSFCMWKTQLNHVTDDLDNMKKKWLNLVQKYAKDDVKFPESLLCLLRFIRNRQVHSKNEMDEIKVMQLFPDLVVTVYKYAKNRNWRIKGFLPLPPSGDRRVDPVPHQEMGTEVASRPEGTMAQTETGVADRLDPLSSTGVEKVAGKAEMDPVQQQKTDCPDNGEENIMDVHTDGSKGLIPMADTPVEVPLHYRCDDGIFRKESPSAVAAPTSISQSSDTAGLLSVDNPLEDLRTDDQHKSCSSCAEVPDSSWVPVKPEVSSEKRVSTYSLSSPAGSYECTVSRLRWSCAGPVSLQYRFTDWNVYAEQLAHMQIRPAGPLMDIKLISGELEEIHLPHFLYLGDSEASVCDAVKVLHGQDSGVCVEECELTRHHTRLLHPSFSLLGPVYYVINLFYPKVCCELLLFCTRTTPLTLHVYVVPNDPSHIEKIREKEKHKGVWIDKPGAVGPLPPEVKVCLTTSCQSVIQPQEINLQRVSTSNYFEIYTKHPGEAFDMELFSSEDTEPIWSVQIRREDYQQPSRMPRQVDSQVAAAFVDKHRSQIISRVTEVMPIADRLLSQRVISQESYSTISAAPTSQARMRALYERLHSAGAQGKLAFYTILQEQERLLVEDLWTT